MTPTPLHKEDWRLDDDELFVLTKRKTAPARQRVLDRMKIPYAVDGDGKLCVARRAREERLAGRRPDEDPDLMPDFSVFDKRTAHGRQA